MLTRDIVGELRVLSAVRSRYAAPYVAAELRLPLPLFRHFVFRCCFASPIRHIELMFYARRALLSLLPDTMSMPLITRPRYYFHAMPPMPLRYATPCWSLHIAPLITLTQPCLWFRWCCCRRHCLPRHARRDIALMLCRHAATPCLIVTSPPTTLSRQPYVADETCLMLLWRERCARDMLRATALFMMLRYTMVSAF